MALNVTGEGNPFGSHVDMALMQGATHKELEELIVFASVYTGFNKGATAMGALNKIRLELVSYPNVKAYARQSSVVLVDPR